MNNDKIKGTFFAVLSAIIFGLTPVLSDLTFSMGSTPMTLTFYRNSMVVPVLLIVLLVRKVDLRISKRECLELAIVGICFSAMTTWILYESYEFVGIGLATTLHFLYPIFTVLFGFLFFRTKLDKPKIVALVLATIGIALATGSNGSFQVKGVALAVGSAITYAAYLLGIEKTSISKMDSMKSMFYFCLFNSIALALIDIPRGQIMYLLEPLPMLYTLIVAVANSGFAYILLIMGIKLIGAGNAAIYSMLEPVAGVISGIIFLGEGLPPLKLISCLIIFTAVAIPIVCDMKASRLK